MKCPECETNFLKNQSSGRLNVLESRTYQIEITKKGEIKIGKVLTSVVDSDSLEIYCGICGSFAGEANMENVNWDGGVC